MYTDPLTGKRRMTRYRLSEKDALEQYGPDTERVEWTRFEPSDLGRTSEIGKGTT